MVFKKSSKNTSKAFSWFFYTAMPAFVVMIALVIVVVMASQYSSEVVEERRVNVITRHAREASTRLQTRINGYEDLLDATRIIVANSQDRSTKDMSWQEFWTLMEPGGRHEGIKAVGYAKFVHDDERQDHEASMRQNEGLENYSISTDEQQPEYAAIAYFAPEDAAATTGLIGYDLFSIDGVQQSLELSRDMSRADIIDIRNSELLTLFDQSLEIDFLLVSPIYQSNQNPETVQERRDELIGYTYAAFNSQEFFGGLMDDNNPSMYTLHLVTPAEETLLYQSPEEPMDPSSNELRSASDAISVAGKAITVTATNTQPLIPLRESRRPLLSLVSGMTLTFFVTAFIYMLTQTRIRKLKEKETTDINQAKDELLALASHQLRTPATGVKQYLGMLRDGYAGPLSKSQIGLIEHAYDSNERQLNTVNELLFVARLDSGRVTLDYEDIDIKSLLKDIVQEQKPTIREKSQKVEIRLPKDSVIIQADEGYLRMALENIVSNASKYTPESGKIVIWVTKALRHISIHVRDTGVGVSDKDMPLLFKKFSRVDNDLGDQVAGTGIGLYLTNKIIEAHGGKITFQSKVKVGSIVTISLPVESAAKGGKQLNISQ